MKKLLFATAIAASAAAFADPINAVAFENEGDYNPNAANSYFYFDGESNSSVVSNDANAVSTIQRTALFATSNNASFLALDTEGGTLWRSIKTITSNTTGDPGEEVTTYALGPTQAVAAAGTYLDTLVQFTVTEDDAPATTNDEKLAIWLQAGEGTTNLMVKAGVIDDQSGITQTSFTLNGTVNPGEWYRLTVKILADITDREGIIGFQIYLDGTLLTSSTPTLTSEYLKILGPDDMNDSHYADLVAGKYFASLVQVDELQGVGFQGTGAVDEIVWTEEDLFPAGGSGADFTLTWDANVTAVSYTIDGTTTDLSSETSPYTITGLAADTAVTVNARAADWYVISSGTGVVTAVAGGTNEIVAALAATPGDAGATGLPSGATTAQVKTWADAKNLTPAQIAACSYAEAAYLLNTDLTNEPTFEIAAIEEVEGGWQITVEAKAGSAEIDLEHINGTLKVKTGATLTALGSATSDDIPAANLSFDSEGKAVIKITGDNKNFIKATVE